MVGDFPGADSKRGRYQSLDCLRGIAALIVMLGHSMPYEYLKKILSSEEVFLISKIFISGYQCVILFFVLSGFALYLMFDSIKKGFSGVSLFLAARWIRLYPVYLFSIMLSMAVYYFSLRSGVGEGTHFSRNNPLNSFSFSDFLGHLTLVGNFDAFKYNSPIWSIVHEVRVSLLFPILFFLVVRFQGIALLPTLIYSLFLSVMYFGYEPDEFQDLVVMPSIGTLHYVAFFMAGALIAHKKDKIIRSMREASRKLIFLLSIFFVTFFFMMGTFPAFVGEKIIYDMVAAAVASGIICLVISFPAVLENSVLGFLGKVFFSLYLVHSPCIVLVHLLFEGKLNQWAIFALSLLLSITLSTVIWWAIERPSLRLSRMVRKGATLERVVAAA